MEENIAIEFRHVSKIYSLNSKEHKNIRGQRFYALKDISFQVEKGQVVGVLGTNGSGKSTLSVVLAGISEVNEGEMIVRGEQALIAIQLGLNVQLTGEENIELKGALLGLSKKKIEEIKQRVVDFAEIGDFLYQPVKKYSSGMKARLGFSINLALDPDIFIIDEALSVGDKSFSQKCVNRMKELKQQGKTILFISHSLPQVREFCDQAIWIESGVLREQGNIDEVCDHYSAYVDYLGSLSREEKARLEKENYDNRVIETPAKKRLFARKRV